MSRESRDPGRTLVIGNRNYSSWSMRPWLALRHFGLPFGAFSAADAMYAPVVGRFLVYHVPLNANTARYAAAIQALPAVEEWCAAARAETEVLPQFKKGPAR